MADTPDTDDIRTRLRVAGEIRAAADALDIIGLIREAKAATIPAAEIARDLRVTEGYVHRIIRETP